jgi:hypothetical protein
MDFTLKPSERVSRALLSVRDNLCQLIIHSFQHVIENNNHHEEEEQEQQQIDELIRSSIQSIDLDDLKNNSSYHFDEFMNRYESHHSIINYSD